MFTFPKHLKGNRIPPPAKMLAIEAQKKLEKQEEEIQPQLKGRILCLHISCALYCSWFI